MKILVYTSSPAETSAAGLVERALPYGIELETRGFSLFARSCKKEARGCFVYIEPRKKEEAAKLGEMAEQLRGLEPCAWGVLDPQGLVADPAALFFAGARDYLGPEPLRKGIKTQRIKDALIHAGFYGGEEKKKTPLSEFPGWEALRPGAEVHVRFCYAALDSQEQLLESIGEKRMDRLRDEFTAFLESWARGAGGIVWIKERKGSLILFPPSDVGRNPVAAAFKLLLDRTIVGYEVFKLAAPLNFRFAFHAGSAPWQPPGATGTLISDDVNFTFHLGMKAPDGGGRILLSSEAASAIPQGLHDCFKPGKDFEGLGVLSSLRFID